MSVVRRSRDWHTQVMKRQTLAFIALAITIFYGVGFAAFDTGRAYAVLGAALVTVSWIAVGVFGQDGARGARTPAERRPRT